MKADAKTEAAVISMLNKFNEAYKKRDLNGLVSLCAPDPDMVLIGTGADERRVGLEELKVQAKRDWSQSEAASFEFGWTLVSAAGSVAWVASEGSVLARVGGQEARLPVRLTAVLEQRDDKWLFAQMHVSFAAAGHTEGESFPA